MSIKKRFFWLLFLVLGFLAGCGVLNPQITTPPQGSEVSIDVENDFSQLDRTLVYRPLSYEECVKKVQESGTGHISSYPEDPDFNICKYEGLSYYNSPYGAKKYTRSGEDRGSIESTFQHFLLPVKEQNSLIELFALTGDALKEANIGKGNPNPSYIRKGKGLPKITFSGAYQDLYTIRWDAESGLLIDEKDALLYDSLTLRSEAKGRSADVLWAFSSKGDDKQEKKAFLLNSLGKDRDFILERKLVNETGEYGKREELIIHIDQIAYQNIGYDPEYCFDTICFFSEYPIRSYKHRLMQDVGNKEEESGEITLVNTQLKIGIKIIYNMMGQTYFISEEKPGYLRNQTIDSRCLYRSIQQRILGNFVSDFPKVVTIFGESYKLQELNLFEELSYGDTNQRGAILEIEAPFADQSALEEDLTSQIKEKGVIHNTYLLRFKNHPNIFLQYVNDNGKVNPEAVYFSEEAIPTDDEGNVLDLEHTIKIFCALRQSSEFEGNPWESKICGKRLDNDIFTRALHDMMFLDEEKGEKADRVQGEDSWDVELLLNDKVLPLYQIEKSPIANYYYIRAAKHTLFLNGGAGCKPVVYVYDQQQRANTLTVTLPPYASFTKLIPDFHPGTTTWEFTSDAESNLSVKGMHYPYLYYSTLRTNYQNNRYGWTVRYEDIPFFLESKLTAMHFNEKEKADFLEYWLPEFTPGFIYSISFKFNEAFEPYAQLVFKHTPEKIFRIFMEAHQLPLSRYASFDPEYPNAGNERYLKVFERGGAFEALERGGNLIPYKS